MNHSSVMPPLESDQLAENHDITALFASEYEIEAIGAQFDKEYSTFRKSLMVRLQAYGLFKQSAFMV